jgi:hypothetical protein
MPEFPINSPLILDLSSFYLSKKYLTELPAHPSPWGVLEIFKDKLVCYQIYGNNVRGINIEKLSQI